MKKNKKNNNKNNPSNERYERSLSIVYYQVEVFGDMHFYILIFSYTIE